MFFFWQQAKISLFAEFISWPSLLMIVGIAFLCQGYGGREYESIFPGVILTGFGLHFHLVNRLSIWPNSLGIFILIIALGFLLRYQKLGTNLFYGLLFLALACLLLFYDKAMSWLGMLETNIANIAQLWPFALILIGVYLLFFKKK